MPCNEPNVQLTPREAKALWVASFFGGPPPEDNDPDLDTARKKMREVFALALPGRRTMADQDPSMDLENVNAAYRIEHRLATVYREALEEIAGGTLRPAHFVAQQALDFDPLSEEES